MPEEGQRVFAHKYMMKVTASVIFSVSSFISLIFMTRYVGEAYGMMMWGMSLVATFNAALDVGFHSANIKKVSEGKDLNKCVSTYLVIRILLSALTILLVLVTSLVMSVLGSGFPPEFWAVTGAFVVFYVIESILMVINGTFTGRMNAGKESAVLTVSYLVRAVFLIVFSVIGASAFVLSLGYVAGGICALIVSLILFRSLKVRLVRPAFFREYMSFVAPLAFPLLLIATVTYVDRILIGAFHGELEVGYYTAAAGVVFSVITIGMVMNGLLLSHMSKLNKEGRLEEARNTLWTAQKYLAALMLPVTVFLLVFGNETAVALFGEDFADSGPVLSVLSVGLFLNVVAGMLAQVLLSSGRNAPYARSSVVYGFVTALLFIVLIPGWLSDTWAGALGAAAAVVAGSFVYVVLLALTARRHGLFSIYPRIYIHVAVATALLALLCCLKTVFEPSGILWVVLLALISVAVHTMILISAKEITRKDVEFVRETLSPKNLYDDLRNELRRD